MRNGANELPGVSVLLRAAFHRWVDGRTRHLMPANAFRPIRDSGWFLWRGMRTDRKVHAAARTGCGSCLLPSGKTPFKKFIQHVPLSVLVETILQRGGHEFWLNARETLHLGGSMPSQAVTAAVPE
jgi:hypothetical protein